MSAKSGSVESDGFRLGYVVEGAGVPTLVIGSSIYYPRVFSSNLRKSMLLACCDHRGFAERVGSTTACIDMPTLIADVELVRQRLGWDEFALVGHSGHSYIALEYAKQYKQHVSHLVLLNAGPNNNDANMQALERDWSEFVSPKRHELWRAKMNELPAAIEAKPANRFVSFMLAMGPRSWRDPAYDAAPLWRDVPVNLDVVDHMWGVLFRNIDISPGLSELPMPVFLGLGAIDFLVPPPRTWEPFRAMFKDLTVRLFENCGHTPMLEAPELFDQELLTWLEKSPTVRR